VERVKRQRRWCLCREETIWIQGQVAHICEFTPQRERDGTEGEKGWRQWRIDLQELEKRESSEKMITELEA
jgi:hypothetical protein